MKKSILIFGCLALAALPLWGATANFQGNCPLGMPMPCVFNANRTPSGGTATSCAPNAVSSYFWNFNSADPNGWASTTSPQVGYTYTSGYCDWVDLTVFCVGGASASQSYLLCTYAGAPGTIRPGAGWTP